MSATLVRLHDAQRGLLTKRELAAEIGRSERWIELRQRDGLPVRSTDRHGRRLYSLRDVQVWMHDESARPRSMADRLSALEREVRELRATVQAIQTGGRR
ncbi:MAG: hypothetical protein ACYCQK_01955 [Acidiferrobacteraceae bacterium]